MSPERAPDRVPWPLLVATIHEHAIERERGLQQSLHAHDCAFLCALEFANLAKASLANADLSGANLSGAKFTGANLYFAVWSNCRQCNPDSIGQCIQGQVITPCVFCS